ncbi:hypothetical protein G6O69_15465 [Pseudenhygromyxa sp. WMMC2535]|uniref:hypothetical protein n=1 Tax=Pseudenhygromyxa sp. WMMC2535 TaxID=2712867 RepID=UPI00159600E8|nr:hypothetical protein [Pseudenhygromyxa sp. WMMC2535]NVB39241.1 hypothetical protein [Pseudenhygromyxa sp. WMMC2535]
MNTGVLLGLLAPAADEAGAASEASSSEDPSVWSTLPWGTLLVILAVILVVALIVWGVIVWRRRQAAAAGLEPQGPGIGERLRTLWEPFYRGLPARAEHFPTIVVMGEAGAGKSHAIATNVDWRGQSNQFLSSVDHGAAMQLYLGPDVVVHELSAAVLRDVGSAAKHALSELWRRMGPSATVLVVVDARTLLSTQPAALRDLGQLVRGKISLFPQRCRADLKVRVLLSHLDEIPGYEGFAAVLGNAHGCLELEPEAGAEAEAERLLAHFDEHLVYGLTTRSADEFDRLVGFYAELPKLIIGLGPLLETLAGAGDPFATGYGVGELYLGSLSPESRVGDPFVVDRAGIAASMLRQRRRGLGGSAAMGVGISGLCVGLLSWHGSRVAAAEQAVDDFDASQDRLADVSDKETEAANVVSATIERMYASEILWFAASYGPSKLEIDNRFEQVIRESYLEPHLEDADRVELLYVTALIYASRDNDLGQLVRDNRTLWADNLSLSDWVIDAYVDASREPYERAVELPDPIEQTGREWTAYLTVLDACLTDGRLEHSEVELLQDKLPRLRGPREYEVLGQVRTLMREDEDLHDRLAPLLTESLDSWSGSNYDALERLSETIAGLRLSVGKLEGWGLSRLVSTLTKLPNHSGTSYELDVGEVHIESETLDTVIRRSRRHELITTVLDDIERRRPIGGRGFFDASARLIDAGQVRGYGGGPSSRIPGMYTRESYEASVAPVLGFADAQLGGAGAAAVVEGDGSAGDEAAGDGGAGGDAAGSAAGADADSGSASAQPEVVDLLAEDEARLEREIRSATASYASAYRQALDEYWGSFEFSPGSAVALPYVLKPFAQQSSWFTDFLRAVVDNASLDLPSEDEDIASYYADLRASLADYGPLLTLLAEDAGTVPGLEPYQGLMAGLQKQVEEAAEVSGDPEAEELSMRLSGLGALSLAILTGAEDDVGDQVTDWLFGAGVDSQWWDPFLAPVEATMGYGRENIEDQLATAWIHDLRPELDPLFDKYPFSPESSEDIEAGELEALVRMQGKLPGSFWERFDSLARPAMEEGRLSTLAGVRAPAGMLATVRDLERMSNTLWDEKGERLPLEIALRVEPLPKEPVDGRSASMASVAAGGSSVTGFNNRPDPQVLVLDWWDQGSAVLSLTMSAPVDEQDALSGTARPDERRYRIFAAGTFSFYHLLDRAVSPDLGAREDSITAVAMSRATRCARSGPVGTKGVSLGWGVLVGETVREVSVVLLSDPWAAFAVRRCW